MGSHAMFIRLEPGSGLPIKRSAKRAAEPFSARKKSRTSSRNRPFHSFLRAISESNRNVGGGFLSHGEQQLTVRGVGYLCGPQDIQDIVLKSEGGTPVTVGDVSRVLLSHSPRLGAVGSNVEGEVAEGFALL